MRTNPLSFALTVGMGLIVLMMGYAALSAAGLVGFAAADVAAATRNQEVSSKFEPLTYNKSKKLTEGVGAPSKRKFTDKDLPSIAAGDALFKTNCTQCHAVNEQVVGPALGGIAQRRSIGWIIPWVRNSAKVVASGDEYAVALYGKFQKQQMPSFQLSDKQIQDIMVYVESQQGAYPGVDDSSMLANN